MISGLEIINFQSYEEAKLDFHPGLNLIIGESDKGKSAILRSLGLVTTNRPLGTDYISWFAKSPTIVTIYKDQYQISRIRGDGIDEFWLDGENLKETLSRDVPEEIQKILKIGPLNMHRQKDGYFLFGESPGSVGRYLNRMVDLEVIDKSLSHATSRLKAFETNKDYIERELAEVKEELSKTEWIEEFNKDLQELEHEEKLNQTRRSNLERLKILTSQHKDRSKRLQEYDGIATHKNEINDLLKKFKFMDGCLDTISKLQRSVSRLEELKEKKKLLRPKVKAILKIKILLKLDGKAAVLNDKMVDIENLLDSKDSKTEALGLLNEEIKNLKSQIEKATAGKCPVCGRED